MSSFVDYFADTYIGQEVYESVDEADENNGLVLRIRRTQRWKEPRFSPKIWSVYERVLNDEPRTTHLLEGWHKRFSTIVTKSHPNIYDFIGCLRSEHARMDTVMSKLLMGETLKNVNRYEKSKTQKIRNVVHQFERRLPLDYVRGIAHNIKYD